LNGSPAPVLIYYDGSSAADRAVTKAAALFTDRTAVVLSVYPRTRPARLHTSPVGAIRQEEIEEVRTAVRHDAGSTAEQGCDLAREAGLRPRPCAKEAAAGDKAWQTILLVAEREDASAIVVGRDREAWDSAGGGQLVLSLVTHSPIPVLVA
jgi:nucleotide-binding universal stress UspA family protein